MSQRVRQERQQMEADELRRVIPHWDIGEVSSIQELRRGSSKAPKVVIESASGAFLLKRLAHARTKPDRIAFQHRLHLALQATGFPIPELIGLKQHAGTLLELEGFSYELCRYIEGRRFDGQPHDARSSGSRLAGFHDLALRHLHDAPPGAGFHERPDVARAAKELHQTRPELSESSCTELARLLESSCTASQQNWDDLPCTVVHGDWHPGNLLFGTLGVCAVLDMETVRAEPRVAELANALLQFTMPISQDVAIAPRRTDTPSMELKQAMLSGYGLVAREPLKSAEINVLPHVMVEALAVEAVIALHRKGRFGRWTGPEFLDFVCHRGVWITDHADDIRRLVPSA